MAKWAIVEKSTNKIKTTYLSDKKEQGTNRFGGPLDNAALFVHVKIPQALEARPLEELKAEDGLCQCEEEDGALKWRLQSQSVDVRDAEGELLKHWDGSQVKALQTLRVPMTEPGKIIKLK
jgi:hypothetical protein